MVERACQRCSVFCCKGNGYYIPKTVQQALASDETAAAVFPIIVRTLSKSGKVPKP